MANNSELTQNPDVFSPPSLPPVLLSLYSGLNEENKQIFYKMFRFIWGEVVPLSRFVKYGGLLYSYWAVDLLRERLGLVPSELSLLSYLYHISKNGRLYIHSEVIYNSSICPGALRHTLENRLRDLKVKGFVTRSTRNPGEPYRQSSQHNKQAVFIKLSPSGIYLIEQMEKDLYKILVNSSFEDLAGTKKKPRKSKRSGQ